MIMSEYPTPLLISCITKPRLGTGTRIESFSLFVNFGVVKLPNRSPDVDNHRQFQAVSDPANIEGIITRTSDCVTGELHRGGVFGWCLCFNLDVALLGRILGDVSKNSVASLDTTWTKGEASSMPFAGNLPS
jgi:hypothetical protein